MHAVRRGHLHQQQRLHPVRTRQVFRDGRIDQLQHLPGRLHYDFCGRSFVRHVRLRLLLGRGLVLQNVPRPPLVVFDRHISPLTD